MSTTTHQAAFSSPPFPADADSSDDSASSDAEEQEEEEDPDEEDDGDTAADAEDTGTMDVKKHEPQPAKAAKIINAPSMVSTFHKEGDLS